MNSYDIWGGRSRIHWERAISVAATFVAASLAPYRFLLKAASHEDTYLEDVRSVCLSNDNTGWKESSARLDAAQSKEVDRAYMFIREIGENIIVPLLRSVEAEEQARRLVKFDQRFKDPNRLKNKVADQLRLVPGRTPIEGLAVIHDTLRFTFQHMENDYVTGVRKDMERLMDRGLIFVSLLNTWSGDQYKGINTRWREPTSGLLFEVQFHTQASFTARELTHRAYERIRCGTMLVGGAEMATLREFQRQTNVMVPIPPGALDIGGR
ncbi:hypothetical protein HD554DRAFT_2041477 [Boletus coccyginus]|nr:hypothetical protein HD554DRAFT_2041477 [Boletus coccyginus]